MACSMDQINVRSHFSPQHRAQPAPLLRLDLLCTFAPSMSGHEHFMRVGPRMCMRASYVWRLSGRGAVEPQFFCLEKSLF